jgi:hypothetical protein
MLTTTNKNTSNEVHHFVVTNSLNATSKSDKKKEILLDSGCNQSTFGNGDLVQNKAICTSHSILPCAGAGLENPTSGTVTLDIGGLIVKMSVLVHPSIRGNLLSVTQLIDELKVQHPGIGVLMLAETVALRWQDGKQVLIGKRTPNDLYDLANTKLIITEDGVDKQVTELYKVVNANISQTQSRQITDMELDDEEEKKEELTAAASSSSSWMQDIPLPATAGIVQTTQGITPPATAESVQLAQVEQKDEASKKSVECFKHWHNKLAHIGLGKIMKSYKKGYIVTTSQRYKIEDCKKGEQACAGCMKGKGHRSGFNKLRGNTQAVWGPRDVLHVDIMGPLPCNIRYVRPCTGCQVL